MVHAKADQPKVDYKESSRGDRKMPPNNHVYARRNASSARISCLGMPGRGREIFKLPDMVQSVSDFGGARSQQIMPAVRSS